MSELKPEVEYVIKTGRHVVEKKQVDFPDTLNKQLDAIKQQYNDLGGTGTRSVAVVVLPATQPWIIYNTH